MSLEKGIETQQFRGRVAFRVLPILILLAVIPLVIMGSSAYATARNLLLEQLTTQLIQVENEEIANLDAWVLSKHVRIQPLGRNEDLKLNINSLSSNITSQNIKEEARSDALAHLRSLNPSLINAYFNDFIITDAEGNILASNNRDWEELSLASTPIFDDFITQEDLTSFFSFNPAPLFQEQDELANEIIQITSLEITEDNLIIGYVMGISNGALIQRQLEPTLNFLPNGTVYIVLDDETFIGLTLLYGLTSIEEPSEGLTNVIQSGSRTEGENAFVYETYDDTPVVGLYNFFPDQNIGLVIEVPQANVFDQINSLAPFSIWLVIITILGTSLFLFYGSRRMLEPIYEITNASRYFAEGDWQRRAIVNRNDEIGLLAFTFNQMADQLQNLNLAMEFEVEERSQHILTASEVAHLATSASNLEELLDRTVNLIVDRFGFYHAAIFLMDEGQLNAQLAEATGQVGQNLKAQGYQIPLTETSIVSWVVNNNKSRIATDTQEDSLHLRHEMLPETHSEVGIPISIGDNVLGVLDVQSVNNEAFDTNIIDVLQTFANQLASAIQNFRLVEGAEVDLQVMSQLFQASRTIGQANSTEEIYQVATSALQKTTFISAIYVPAGDLLKLIEIEDEINSASYQVQLPNFLNLSIAKANDYFNSPAPIIIRDVQQPQISIHSEILAMPRALDCLTAAVIPIYQYSEMVGIIVIGSREEGTINPTILQPFTNLTELISTAGEKINAEQTTHENLRDLQIINNLSLAIGNETDLEKLYTIIHDQIIESIGDVEFFIAFYDSETEHIEIPYMYEGGDPIHVDPFPIGEGLTSIVIRTKKPLMLVENTEERSRALGARVSGNTAKSWLGLPLITGGEVIGTMTMQDVEHEHRFSEDDLRLLTTMSSQIASVVNGARILEESHRRSVQLQTAAEIAKESSGTLEIDELLKNAINLIRDRFNFYHASVFLLDKTNEFAIVRESTGEAGEKMKEDEHKLQVGSQSIIGNVTSTGEPLVVHDVTADPTHKFNPLLPDTRAELGIPLKLGDRILGALDVQSTIPYSFSSDDIEVLQILADQLAVAVRNAELFSSSQEHLAQHRLIHHVTTVAASSTSLEDSLNSAVQGLRVTLGDRVAILILDVHENILRVGASAGYEDDIIGFQIEVGQGITGWVAEQKEPLLVKDTLQDPRYIPGKDSVRSEVAVPLIYRGELLGVLNVESDEVAVFDEYDLDILGTLAGSLSAIIVNTRLSERQQQLFEVTNKIRRSVSMENILETTATELSKALRARKASIQVGGSMIAELNPNLPSDNGGAAEEEPNGNSEGTES